MNKVILVGRLTKDAEIRKASTDKKVARCTLAVNRTYKREDEEQSADFINLVSFKNQADFLEKYGKKGTKFIVIGRIQTGSYEKDGTRIFTTDVIVEQLEFAESKNSSGIESEEYTEVPEGFDGLPFK
ncbi:single-stranded DNA-binding protein [Butyrivibrio sp. M55]|uniref:single-stranded DNA-binding protein n=1 Tax=Butyrivibrio sp. M55 TaxID=1855323 RepID=UPI0008DF2758|nr:single-stranded DNA-binding protein [Butyrivibrio sp. M55]SFU95769.1 single-strand binding protein [Butyrivibrio sp. M55]